MRRASSGICLAATVALGGCNLAPAYAPPSLTLPTSYKETGPWTPASPADAAPRGDWWTVYADDTLNGLEQRIETGNPDLALALARYDEARAYAAEARASQYPEVDLGASATTNRESANRPLRVGGPNYYGNDFAAATVSYEIDLWGRVRNLVAAGKYQAQASGADAASVRLSLEAQLADAYLSLRGLDAEAKLLADTTAAYTIALRLTETLHNGGAVAGLDVARAQTQLQTAKAQQVDIGAQRALYEHEIAALVGQPASSFSIPPMAMLPTSPQVPVATPSVILQRRPDIAAAERRAAAANAMIGVSRAAFYPSISLDATGGFQNTGNGNLLTAANSWWTLGPTLAMTLFDGGRRKAALRAARDQFDEAGDSYRSTVLAAFQQVEDNLALCNRLADEEAQQAAAVAAARHAEDLAMIQYRQGEVTYLDVVTAQTIELQAEVTVLAIATRRLQAGVDLVRSLGGGWDVQSIRRAEGGAAAARTPAAS
ncbi:efflux transporter outer membrane subunit [Phenylobacterium sp.]|uniref:efflux transporter outer membrane subunit n=1 Tax=Phenylobacterium sp. TaxID=1871053 RepID=UPI00121666A4|nr:efflux transporter outer membrane subunit [Phenylobacterium sp.]THD57507.1 MAG: efflux transporter outer membrane subunit [Phenylobacterium sp.]